jgi:hypothetical protein
MISLLARIRCESEDCDESQDFEVPQYRYTGTFGIGVGTLGDGLPEGWADFEFNRDGSLSRYKSLCPTCSEKMMARMKERDDDR